MAPQKTFVGVSLAPFLVRLFNSSLSIGYIPSSLNIAQVRPILKKAILDPHQPSSYRPISNLSGSVNVDLGSVSLYLLLDMSVAFNTVDHGICLNRLEKIIRSASGGMVGSDLTLLVENKQYCQLVAVTRLLRASQLAFHRAQSSGQYSFFYRYRATWASSNRLNLNSSKIDAIWFSTESKRHLIPTIPLRLNGPDAVPSETVRNLGTYLDSGLTMDEHEKRVSAGYYTILRVLREAKPFISYNTFITLVVQFILTKLDYCNSLLTNVSGWTLNPGRVECSSKAYLWIHDFRAHHTSIEKSPFISELPELYGAQLKTYFLMSATHDKITLTYYLRFIWRFNFN